MKVITSTGQYTNKQGSQTQYSFEYQAFESLQDAISELGEDKVFRLVQRMAKVDANNTAREGAKVANGDSVRKAMTEEQKAQAKAQRATDRELLKLLKAKGINGLDDLQSVL